MVLVLGDLREGADGVVGVDAAAILVVDCHPGVTVGDVGHYSIKE